MTLTLGLVINDVKMMELDLVTTGAWCQAGREKCGQ